MIKVLMGATDGSQMLLLGLSRDDIASLLEANEAVLIDVRAAVGTERAGSLRHLALMAGDTDEQLAAAIKGGLPHLFQDEKQ